MDKKYIVDLTSVSDQSEETKTLLENATSKVDNWSSRGREHTH